MVWNNFPSDSKFGKIKDNLRLTSTTLIPSLNQPTPPAAPIYASGVGHVGPKSSISFYAYNIPTYTKGPDGRQPGSNLFAGEPWFDGQNPSEVPLTNNAGNTYSHTVGGGAIVLEPSGNRLLYADDQYDGNETPYELNFYLRSGGATGAADDNTDWVELNQNEEPILSLQNERLIRVNTPIQWKTNDRSQKGPAILDTEAAPGVAGGYRKAEFITTPDNDHIMVYDPSAFGPGDIMVGLIKTRPH